MSRALRSTIDLRRANDHFLLAVLLLFLLADLPALLGLTEADNRLFVAAVPYLLVLGLGFLAIRRSTPADALFAWMIAVTAFLYVTSFFSPTLQHPVARAHIAEWIVQKTGFVITLLLLYWAYGLVRSNSPDKNRALLDLFVKISLAVIVASFVVYIVANFAPFLPGRVIIYGEQRQTLFGMTWLRFGATLKEPFEFALLSTFLVTYLVAKRRFIQAAVLVFISLFSFSNFLSVGFLFALGMAVGIRMAPRSVVAGLVAVFAAAGFVFYALGPKAEYFAFLDVITPRSYSLLSYRPEAVQRLWSNIIAVREFAEFDWPLGGGAGFLRAYTRDFYFYTAYKSHAAGAGVFRFLMDFGVFGIPLVVILSRRLHRRVVTALPGKQLGAKVLILLCVFVLCVRTGYLNVSVWTLIFMLYYGYLRPTRTESPGKGIVQHRPMAGSARVARQVPPAVGATRA